MSSSTSSDGASSGLASVATRVLSTSGTRMLSGVDSTISRFGDRRVLLMTGGGVASNKGDGTVSSAAWGTSWSG